MFLLYLKVKVYNFCMTRKEFFKKYENIFETKEQANQKVIEINKEEDKNNLLSVTLENKHKLPLEITGAKIFDLMEKFSIKNAFVKHSLTDKEIASVANGFILKSWKFDKYKKQKFVIDSIAFKVSKKEEAKKELELVIKQTESIIFARELICTPANDLYPEKFVEEIKNEIKGVEMTIIKGQDLVKKGFLLVDAVGKGSTKTSCVVIIKKEGSDEKEPKIALVGKGVCFDTGGISIKPADRMEQMIYDMTGAAAVISAVKTLVAKNEKTGFYALVALVENMPDGNATRPGDIVECTFSKKTCEILNTDAEGRLILADLVAYASYKLGCEKVVTIATLTGAAKVVSGTEFALICSNSPKLACEIIKAGEETEEKVYPMPFISDYDKYVESDHADLRNISGMGAGVITGGKFIALNVKAGVDFCHIDMANMGKGFPLCSSKYEVFGSRLLTKFIENTKKDNVNYKEDFVNYMFNCMIQKSESREKKNEKKSEDKKTKNDLKSSKSGTKEKKIVKKTKKV